MSSSAQEETTWISGLVSVQATVTGGNRTIAQILIQNDRLDGATARLQRTAREKAIPMERVSEAAIQEHMHGDQHGGVIAEVGSRRFLGLQDLLGCATEPAIFMIDGVEDPHNFGQAVRSLYAAGATGLVVRSRNWLLAGDTILRSSAGASELMPMGQADSLDSAADFFRAHGLVIMAAAQTEAIQLTAVDLRQAFFMVIGGEKRGLNKSFLRSADLRLSIPYGRSFDAALGTVAATSILSFEMLRQRGLAS